MNESTVKMLAILKISSRPKNRFLNSLISPNLPKTPVTSSFFGSSMVFNRQTRIKHHRIRMERPTVKPSSLPLTRASISVSQLENANPVINAKPALCHPPLDPRNQPKKKLEIIKSSPISTSNPPFCNLLLIIISSMV
ncbi:MAG: hypothetical protein ABOK23_09515 [Candidatus Methanoperedens sp.]